MNKKELIDYCNAIKENKNQFINCIDVNRIIKRIEQLDEPQKVVVPQFVTEWYEENKTNLEYNIWEYIYNWDKQNVSQIKTWFDYSSNKPLQTLINMKQFGYEVEKEKRYHIKLKDTNQYLRKDGSKTRFSSLFISDFTINDIEGLGFGWVFDCEGIEVQEVTE